MPPQSTYSLKFDGTGYVLTSAYPVTYNPRGVAYSFGGWVKGNCSRSYLFGESDGSHAVLNVIFNSGVLNFGSEGGAGGYAGWICDLSDGGWHHLLIVLPSSWVYNTDAVLYIDGALASTTTANDGFNSTQTGVILGGRGTGSLGYVGNMDDWFLCAGDQSANVAGIASGSFDVDTLTNLILWRMEEGTGTTTADSSGNANTGTLSGGVTWLRDLPPALDVAPFANGFRRRKPILYGSVFPGSGLSDFPKLLKIASDTDIATAVASGGILLTADDGTTELPIELRRGADPSTGTFDLWAQLPDVLSGASTGDVMGYLYYDAGETTAEDHAGTWANGYALVMHLEEDPSGSSPQMYNSVTEANVGTASGTPAQEAKQVGDGIGIPDTSSWITVPFSATPSAVTIEAIAQCDSFNSTFSEWCSTYDHSSKTAKADNACIGWTLCAFNGEALFQVANYATLGSTLKTASAGSVPLNDSLHDYAGVYDGTNLLAYFDGTLADTEAYSGGLTYTNAFGTVDNLNLGKSPFVGGLGLDELRISSVARSADWLAYAYQDDFANEDTFSLGPEELDSTPVPGIAGCVLWLDAAAFSALSDGDPVGAWPDWSGNGNTGYAQAGAFRPTYQTNEINSLPVVRFAGTDSYTMTFPDFLSALTEGSIFLVLRNSVSATASMTHWGGNGDTDYYPFVDSEIYVGDGGTTRKSCGNPSVAGVTLTDAHIFGVTTASGAWTLRLNGSVQYTTASNTVGWDSTPELGRNIYGGDIAEVIVYDTTLGSTDRQAVEAYLTAKWFGGGGGGTEYTQSLAGSCTATGTLTKSVTKALAGSTTAAGALAKSARKALAGSMTTTGALAKSAAKPLAGSSTATGTLTKSSSKPLAGSMTGSGALTKSTSKSAAGSCTVTGDATNIRAALQSLGGSVAPTATVSKSTSKSLIGSSTASGTLAKSSSKSLAGSSTSTGALAKSTSKSAAGSCTATGDASSIRAALQTLSGSVTVSGTITKAPSKSLAGSSTAVGTLTKSTAKSSAGSCTITGDATSIRAALQTIGGSVTPTATLVKMVLKGLAGTVTVTGALTSSGGTPAVPSGCGGQFVVTFAHVAGAVATTIYLPGNRATEVLP